MNAHRINTATGPQSGLMAWSCTAALKPQGQRVAIVGSFAMGGYRHLDRSEGPMYPGEGSA